MSRDEPAHGRFESGETCPSCMGRRMVRDTAPTAWRLICPACCHVEH